MSVTETIFAHLYKVAQANTAYAGVEITKDLNNWRVGITKDAKVTKRALKGKGTNFLAVATKDHAEAYRVQSVLVHTLTRQQTLTKRTAFAPSDKLSVFIYRYRPSFPQVFRSK